MSGRFVGKEGQKTILKTSLDKSAKKMTNQGVESGSNLPPRCLKGKRQFDGAHQYAIIFQAVPHKDTALVLNGSITHGVETNECPIDP